ncbi:MAG TPA: alginate lyase family protein [Vicinamibacterales bacterium]|nr:alginate lyase family protein [Vicinamibacterales bacterium]
MNLRDTTQELIELGPRGLLFRTVWEVRGRTGLVMPSVPHRLASGLQTRPPEWTHRVSFEAPERVADRMSGRIPTRQLTALRRVADDATIGRILCFGRWTADFGNPIEWHRNPVTARRWTADVSWRRALADQAPGDVKHVWEIARFPHAYHFARAAAFFPQAKDHYAAALINQIEAFVCTNTFPRGVHWASGQEIAFRLLAWLFALDVLLSKTPYASRAGSLIAGAMAACATHIEAHLDYARLAVYNNHLLSEALALLAAGTLLQELPQAERWRVLGRRALDEEADRQFYADGGYIQQSHNYHRVALQDYLWACVVVRAAGESPAECWLRAMDRSLAFLLAHQNPADGRLPNYGANDGALPVIASTCDFSDMRPILQAVSVLVRGARIYKPGPWDETTAWFAGVDALDAPLRVPTQRSVSFARTGYHVLRGADSSNFSAFRCGTLRDRFSQIDMLHLDVWWRGQNVLVDPGSYQYNAAPGWHAHFMRTAAHNTVIIDGRDQMLHHRQFKVLYRTRAGLKRFADQEHWAVCGGEHYGYVRHAGRCIHRRSVLYLKDDVWIVADQVCGRGHHSVRLHWLGGDFPWVAAPADNGMDLRTSSGVFTVRTFTAEAAPLGGDVIAGSDEPPRGWLSRYYGEKVAVPSFATELTGSTPITIVSVLAGAQYDVTYQSGRWMFESPRLSASFAIENGSFEALQVMS